jgi:hypothetical protein
VKHEQERRGSCCGRFVSVGGSEIFGQHMAGNDFFEYGIEMNLARPDFLLSIFPPFFSDSVYN